MGSAGVEEGGLIGSNWAGLMEGSKVMGSDWGGLVEVLIRGEHKLGPISE